MTDARWLDASQQHVWRTYLLVQAGLNARLGQQLQADSELSLSDFAVLVRLTEAPGQRVRVLELARYLEWEKSRLSHHLARMHKRGLIRREECPSDARGSFVVVTEAGRRAIEEAAPEHAATVKRLFFQDLTPAELAALDTVLGRIAARLTAETEPARPAPGRGRPGRDGAVSCPGG